MNKRIMFLLFLGMTFFFSSTASAHFWNGKSKGQQCPREMGKDHYQCPIASKFMMKAHFLLEQKNEIGLTEDQVKTIKDLKLQMEKDSLRQSADMKTFMLDLHSKLGEDKVDVEGTNSLIDKSFSSASIAAKSNLEAYAKLKGLLNVDQIAKMKQLHEEMEKKEGEQEK